MERVAVIESAFYAVNNFSSEDIAEHITAVLSGGNESYIDASNVLPVGDTCPGKTKYLWINLTANGEKRTLCIREGDRLTMSQLRFHSDMITLKNIKIVSAKNKRK
jgi:hypothetical protein